MQSRVKNVSHPTKVRCDSLKSHTCTEIFFLSLKRVAQTVLSVFNKSLFLELYIFVKGIA